MVRVALLGAGRWGQNLLRTLLAAPGCQLTWVVDADPQRLASLTAVGPGVTLSTDPDAAIAAQDVDAVVISTPTSTHASLTWSALTAGRHVLVEKPMALSVAEAREAGEEAQRRGLTLMVGHVYLFHPGVEAVRRTIADGAVGEVRALRFERTNLGPVRADVDAAWDLAAHDLSIAEEWLGQLPTAVSASGACLLSPGRADSVAATLRYASGQVVQLHVGWLEPTRTRRATVVGSRALMRFDEDAQGPHVRCFERRLEGDQVVEGPERSLPLEPGEPLAREVEHFLSCVRTGQVPISGAVRGQHVVRVLEAISRSMAQAGAEVPV